VKTKKKNITVRELFKQTLGSSEVIPDASVRSKLMRSVERKEFMRFNPARINIYYLGGILISGITIAALLFSASENSDRSSSSVIPDKISKPDSSLYLEILIAQPLILRKKPDTSIVIHKEPKSESIDSQLPVKSEIVVFKVP